MRDKATAVIVSIGLMLSSAIFGLFFYQSRRQDASVSVVGAATKRFGSDIIKWRLTLARGTSVEGMREGYSQIKGDLRVFSDLLAENGIPRKDLTVQPVNTNSNYDSNGNSITGYTISQSVYLISKDVDKIEKMALNSTLLIDKGVFVQSSGLEFFSSEIDQIKKDLLAEATKDARRRAERIAQSAGNEVTQITSARSGVFQITEPYSTEVSDYGVYSTASREKDITVTVNAAFGLK